MEWSTTPLGPRNQWSAPLRAAADLVDAFAAPAWLWWGPDAITIANPACLALLGDAGQGVPAEQLAGEAWAAVRGHGHGDEVRIPISRDDGPDEAYFSLAVTPIAGDTAGSIAGRLCTLTDITAHVLGQRGLDTLYR